MTRFAPQWIQAGDYPAGADRRLIGAIWPTAAVSGMLVTPASAMTVNISAGQAAAPAQNGTGAVLCTSDAVEQVTLAAAPGAGLNRNDLIVCTPRGNDLDGGANNDWVFAAVTGSAAASPGVPAVPAGSVGVAQIFVPGASVTVTAPNITDIRPPRLTRPFNTAWGLVAPAATITAPQVNFTARADIAGLSITWNGITNRLYRALGILPQTIQNAAAGTQLFYVTSGAGTILNQSRNTAIPVNQGGQLTVAHIATAVGPTTWKLQLSTSAGNCDVANLTATQYAILTVEDVGPVPGSPGT